MDSEVLRIIIDLLKEQTTDNAGGDKLWQENAQWYLDKIGSTYIYVTSWEYEHGIE